MTLIRLWFGRVLGRVLLDPCAKTPELRRQALDIGEAEE